MKKGVSNIEKLDAPGRTAVENRNVGLVRQIMEGFARTDFMVLASNLAPGGDIWVQGLSPEKVGNMMEMLGKLPQIFSNGMHFTIKQVAVEGHVVFVEWDDEAITSRGLTYRNNGVSVFTFNDQGRILSYHEYIDSQQLFAVL